jgi:hypothetical protein
VSNWEIEEVKMENELKGCCVFTNEYSGMVIDLPECSNKEGLKVIQGKFNGRGSQRWVIEKVVESVVIRNLCSSMVLSPHGRVVKAGTKIDQIQFTNKMEEKWLIEKIDDKYLIKNRKDNKMYLGVASTKESASLQLVAEEEKGMWKLEGSLPLL